MTDLIAQNSYPLPGTPATAPCVHCGCTPTINATIRGHRGILVVMQFLAEKGPFCRDCGIATVRRLSSKTMAQGWYSYVSFVIAPFVLLWNVIQRMRLGKLGQPVPAADGSSGTPMPVGRPALLRPGAIGLAFPLAIVAFLSFVASAVDPSNHIGQCVVVKHDYVSYVDCDQPNDGQLISVTDTAEQCPAESTGYVDQLAGKRGGKTKLDEVLCLK